MKHSIFILGLIMLIYSCGKEIASAIASNPSNLTTAPWRTTRGTIASDSTNTLKDKFCVSEFGADYVVGSTHEAMVLGTYTSTGSSINPTLGVSDFDQPITGGGIGPVRLFCIHK